MNLNYWNWKNLTVIVSLLYCPQIVLAQSFVDQVQEQLIHTAKLLKVGDNYQLTHDPVISMIRKDGTKTHVLTLDAGIPYVIVGVCDNDCRDIDLRLYDNEGDEVASDIDVDKKPLIRVASQPKTAKFKLEVIMNSCSAPACYYGVGIFGQPAEEISKIDKISPEPVSPEQVVRDYYNNLDKGRVNAALDQWKFSSKSQELERRGLAEGIEWFKLHSIKLIDANSKSATVSAEVSGKKKGKPPERWSVIIDLAKISGEWKITSIGKAR